MLFRSLVTSHRLLMTRMPNCLTLIAQSNLERPLELIRIVLRLITYQLGRADECECERVNGLSLQPRAPDLVRRARTGALLTHRLFLAFV